MAVSTIGAWLPDTTATSNWLLAVLSSCVAVTRTVAVPIALAVMVSVDPETAALAMLSSLDDAE